MKIFFSLAATLLCCSLLAQNDTVKIDPALSSRELAQDYYNQGLDALKRHVFAQAAELFTKSIQADSSMEKAWANRAAAFTQLEKYPEALSDIQRSTTLNPSNPDNYFNKSLVYFQQHKNDSQRAALKECLKLKADHAEATYYMGVMEYDNGDYEKAIGYFSAAISANRNYSPAFNDRGSAKRAQGDLAGAIADYEKALIIDSSLVYIHNNLGSAYRAAKDPDKALVAFTKALRMQGNYVPALLNRGSTFLDKNELPSARADFERARDLDPKNSNAFNNLSAVSIKEKDYKKARDLATKAIELDPKNGAAYYNRGVALQMLHEEEGSCQDWQKASELGVSVAAAYLNTNCLH